MTATEIILLFILMVISIVFGVVILYYRRVLNVYKKQAQYLGIQLYFHQTWMNTYLSKIGISSKTIH